jgi:HEAT repeat protein
LFIAAKWLRYAPENATWRSTLMRQLTKVLQNESLAAGVRARALSAIALSGSSGVDALFRQMLVAPDKSLHLFAALGSGMLRDTKAVNELKESLKDIQPHLWRAACLALVAIGHPSALEAIADILLHGNEDQRRAAAEALANNPEEGYPTLKEGAKLDDLLVRKAVVYGLARIRQPWALDLLGKMQMSDAQWVVKDAAMQTLEDMARPNSRLPKRYTDLTETPWLIAFAGERGIGISPGRPVIDLLLLALKEGKEEQQMAAMEYFSRHTEIAAVPVIEELYKKSQGDVREAALLTLWHYAAAGIRLLQPV